MIIAQEMAFPAFRNIEVAKMHSYEVKQGYLL